MSTEPPSLAARLEHTGPLSWREAARLAARIARALDRLHAQSQAHGGLEPLTVLFVGGTVRLADPLPPASRHPAFLAPWVAAGEPAGRRGDFLALGRLMAAMLGCDPQAPDELTPAILPPPLLAVQRRLVSADASIGYGSGNDIAAALELALAASEGFAVGRLDTAPEPEARPAPMGEPPAAPDLPPVRSEAAIAPRSRRRRPRLVAALVALLALGVIAVVWLAPQGEPEVEPPAIVTDRSPGPPAVAVDEAATGPQEPPTAVLPEAELPSLEEVLAALPDLPLAEPPERPDSRSTVAALLAGVAERPCTRLEVEPTALGLRLVGTTASPTDRTELLAAIAALDDVDKVTLDLDASGSFCRLYDMLAAHAVPAMPRLADLFPARSDYVLAATEPLVLRVLTPAFASHLVVDYFTADGMVVHLAPHQPEGEPLPPAEVVRIGDPADGQWLTIAEPFGHELIVVIASPEPLFAEARPQIEPAPVYLEELEKALGALRQKPEASTIGIETIAARP